jgi:hypothetical protein
MDLNRRKRRKDGETFTEGNEENEEFIRRTTAEGQRGIAATKSWED